jgi:RHS repeat-associated protein
MGTITVTAGGAVTLAGNASKFFTITTSSRAATLKAKVKPVTIDCNGYSMCFYGLYISGVPFPLVPQGAQQGTAQLIPERRYWLGDQWSCNADSDSCAFGSNDDSYALSVLANGTVTINDAVARASFTTSGSTARAVVATLTLDYKGYETQFTNSLPGVMFSGWGALLGLPPGIGTSFTLLRGRRFLMGDDSSSDPATDNWSFSEWTLGGDVKMSAGGAVSLGPDSSRHMSVIGTAALAPRLGYVRIERGSHTGSLCVTRLDLSCAPANADLQAALIIGRDYRVDNGFSFGTPLVRVNANGSCTAASVVIDGVTFPLRCGLTRPPPGNATPPPAPTGLTGVASGPGRVDLVWPDVARETGYRVQRSGNGTSFTDIRELGANNTAFSDDMAIAGATNHYRVIAFNQNGPSAPSNVVAVAVPAPAACGGVNNPCPDPAVTQYNHNAPRIDFRREPLPVLRASGLASVSAGGTDASGGELPVRPSTVSCVGSRVDDLRWSYTQDSIDLSTGPDGPDCVSCGCGAAASVAGKLPSLQLRRYHRPRLEHMVSSLGPGVFTNFDAKLTFHAVGVDGQPNAVLFDPETDAPPSTFFERSSEDGDDLNDGILRDKEVRGHRRLVLYNGSSPSAPRASSASSATLAVLEKHDGGAVWFELMRTNPGNPDQVDGRPVAYVDRNGNRFNVAYQYPRTATDEQLAFDRSQLWKMAKVTDVAHGLEITFDYLHRFTTSRWLVRTVTARGDDGTTRVHSYRYSDAPDSIDTLVEVKYPDGDTSLFSKSYDAATQLWRLSYDDVGVGSKARKTVSVTGLFFQAPGGTVHGQSTNLVRRVVNGSGEEVLRLQEHPNDPKVTFVYEGNRRLTRMTTDALGAPREVARARAAAADPMGAVYDVLESYQTNAQGMITQATDGAGKSRLLVRDAKTRRIASLTARDGTTASWTYNSNGQPTRQVDRVGRITDATYDSRGNLLTLVQAPGTPLQATTQLTYSSTTGQLLSRRNPLGRVTDFAYNRGYLASITEPPDASGGARATSSFQIGSFGLLTSKTDAGGRRTTLQYDGRNRLVATTFADGTQETISYGTRLLGGLVVAETDRRGVTTSYEYDSTRRLKKIIRASNRPEKLEEVFEYVPGTELVSAVTSGGERTEYVYDERNREISKRQFARNGAALVTRKTYDADDRFTTEIDPYDRKTFLVYDGAGRVVRTVREMVPGGVPAGAALATLARVTTPNPPYLIEDTTLDGAGQVLARVDARGVFTSYAYDLLGRQIEMIEAAGSPRARTTRKEYDLAGNLTRVIHPRTFREGRPFHTTYTYTWRDLQASETRAAGAPEAATTSSTYTPTRAVATATDARGGVTTNTYDSNDRALSVKDAANFTTSYAYDANGSVTSASTPLGHATTYTYDGHGRRLTVRNPAGQTTSYQYDDNLTDGVGLDASFASHISGLGFGVNANGSAVLSTNPAGETSLLVFDGLQRQVLSVNGLGQATRTAYDAVVGGLVETAVTDPLGNVARKRVNAAEQVRQIVDRAGKITDHRLDGAGNLLSSRDPNGVGRDCAYDELRQRTSCTDTQGDTTAHEHDAAGNVTAVVDGAGARSLCVFDARDRSTRCEDRNGAGTIWVYDKNGNVTSQTDAQNGVTRYAYDARNLKTSATFPDSSSSTDLQRLAYDSAGRLTSVTMQNGTVISYGYDAVGRLTQRSYPDAKNDSYTYDAASRLKTASSARYGANLAWTYDLAGQTTKESLTFQGQTYDVSHTFDPAGRPTRLRFPDASELNRTFTARGQLASLALGTRAIASYAYDDGGRLTGTTLGNGLVESRVFRPDDQVTSITTPGVGDFSYSYDRAKRKLSEAGAGAPASPQTFGYDAGGRLRSWSDASSTQSWVLSLVGDWTSTTRGSATETRTHNAAHELTAVAGVGLTYDARGNMTKDDKGQTLTFDPESRLQKLTRQSGGNTTTVTYFYDALGRKVAKTVASSSPISTNTTVFVSAGQDTIAEYVNGAVSVDYLLGAAVDQPVAFVKGGAVRWFTRNQLGSVAAVTDDLKAIKERYRYTAFGERTILSPAGGTLTASAVGNQIGFTGRYHDQDTGLMDFRFRQYNPRLGRFISRDDEYRDGANLYMAGFVPNATDPTGHAPSWGGGQSRTFGRASIGGSGSTAASLGDPRRQATMRSSCPTIHRAGPDVGICSSPDEEGCVVCDGTSTIISACMTCTTYEKVKICNGEKVATLESRQSCEQDPSCQPEPASPQPTTPAPAPGAAPPAPAPTPPAPPPEMQPDPQLKKDCETAQTQCTHEVRHAITANQNCIKDSIQNTVFTGAIGLGSAGGDVIRSMRPTAGAPSMGIPEFGGAVAVSTAVTGWLWLQVVELTRCKRDFSLKVNEILGGDNCKKSRECRAAGIIP